MTSEPGSFKTDLLSPVIILSLTSDLSSITIPSAGIFPPGLTKIISLILSSFSDISFVLCSCWFV
jgi:hypothetical protein